VRLAPRIAPDAALGRALFGFPVARRAIRRRARPDDDDLDRPAELLR
jgi:hypothetical protein